MLNSHYDVVIVGGGLVGMSLALSLMPSSLRVCLLESVSQEGQKKPTLKPLVLSHSSRLFFEGITAWGHLKPYTLPIENIHVSEQGRWGAARFEASQHKIPAFGYVIESNVLEQKLREQLKAHEKQITVLWGARLSELTPQENLTELKIEFGDQNCLITARLVVGADGTFSEVRRLLKMGVQKKDFGQTAIVGSLKVKNPQRPVAFERFLKGGALAVLPYYEDTYAFVYTVLKERAEQLMSLSVQDFLEHIQLQFGYRLGKIQEARKIGAYPIQQVLAKEWSQSNVVLVGNAAHTLHPIAAQGFNLALRDIALLSQYIHTDHQHLSLAWLPDYVKTRKKVQRRVISWTNFLTQAFYPQFWGAGALRGFSLFLLDSLAFVKHPLIRFASGLQDLYPSHLNFRRCCHRRSQSSCTDMGTKVVRGSAPSRKSNCCGYNALKTENSSGIGIS